MGGCRWDWKRHKKCIGGAYITSMQYSISKYLSLFQKRNIQLLKEKVVQRTDTYNASVYTTWLISYERLDPPARGLLHVFSFLHHENILLSFFEKAAQNISSFNPVIPYHRSSFREFLRRHHFRGHSSTTRILYTKTEAVAFNAAQGFLRQFQDDNASWDKDKFCQIAHQLLSYSLIHFDAVNNSYSIHPLVQE